MNYKSYTCVISDIEYLKQFNEDSPRFYHRRFHDDELYSTIIDDRTMKRISSSWFEHIKNKFEQTKGTNTSLGKFLGRFPLEFKEFCCLIDLVRKGTGKFSMFSDEEDDEASSPFAKYKVRYESSQLKRLKLVFKIINPLRPLRTVYEVSYKAQLALKNKPYTNEYEQLDMAMEEESKKSNPNELDGLYYVIEPKVGFGDLVISEDVKEKLRSAIARDKKKEKIFKDWGFNNVLEYGKGTTLNFRGPPGTGKTLAANVMAKELGKKLLMVRYDQVQSAYVGETEKHIQRIFNLAGKKNAVLFFDEADAIALNRNTLDKSWEMSQVNTLLKELERFEGVCIFATNFSQKYDPAFERRLTMHIDFEMPDKSQALIILNKLIPNKSRESNFSVDSLEIEGLSGGDLKNVALNAAGIAVRHNSDKISINHVKEAVSMIKIEKINKLHSMFG